MYKVKLRRRKKYAIITKSSQLDKNLGFAGVNILYIFRGFEKDRH